MKNFTLKYSFAIFLIALFVLIQINASQGPANIQKADRTGSPLADGTCANCHLDGAFNPAVSLAFFNSDDEEVTEFAPGEDYNIQVSISHDGATRFGFQLVALAPDDSNAGDFVSENTEISVVPLNDRKYAEHNTPLRDNVLMVKWIAPEVAPDSVTFYVAANAANGNGNTGGDGIATSSSVLYGSPLSSSRETQVLNVTQFPNPVIDHIQFNVPADATYDIQIYDAFGKILDTYKKRSSGEIILPANHWNSGIYFWLMTNGQEFQSGKFIKR